MDRQSRWLFSKMRGKNPNMKLDKDPDRELVGRQRAATLIHNMGLKLHLSQLCICTSTVYMQRFYSFNSFHDVDENKLAMAAIFIATKGLSEFRKIEHVIKVAHACINRHAPYLDVKSEIFLQLKEEILYLENILLQALGFDLHVEHPHQFVVKICQLINGSKELARKSYLLATASIMLSTMCLQYKPMTVACVCINLAARWSQLMIKSGPGKYDWFYYVDQSLTADLLKELTDELSSIMLKSLKSMNSPVLNCVQDKASIGKSFLNVGEKTIGRKRSFDGKPLPLYYAYPAQSSLHKMHTNEVKQIIVKISTSLVSIK